MIEVIEIIANVATGVILFQVLKRQHEGIALGYVAVRIFESAIIAPALALYCAGQERRQVVSPSIEPFDPTQLNRDT